ncbi:MAG: SDR family NAD(P)-dependent oxidoreductase [Terracidiphilus sp.]|jgi:NADP-dependent 3-hydroxy acid dehydrogenase YdfG
MPQRTWFITGVSSGFGRQLTDQLLERGDSVVGIVRDTGKVADLIDRYPRAFHAEVLDVTDTAAVREVVDRSFARFGRIDVVISNAGKPRTQRADRCQACFIAGAGLLSTRRVTSKFPNYEPFLPAGQGREGNSRLPANPCRTR